MKWMYALAALADVVANRVDGRFTGRPPSTGSLAIYVNGYGAPLNVLADGSYYLYLSSVFDTIDVWDSRITMIYLCGGFTNRGDCTEAAAMQAWIEQFAPQWASRVRLIEGTTTVRENIVEFATRWGAEDGSPVLFCEYSREFTVAALAAALLPEGTVITTAGVRFSERDLAVGAQLKQVLVNLPVELASLRFKVVEGYRARERAEVIAKARVRAAEDLHRAAAAKGQ